MRLPSRWQADRRLVDAALRRFLPPPRTLPLTVRRAMAYSLFPGGKRLGPILAITACRARGGRASDVLPAAAAIEMIHTYSLIHDDLPALDNDDLRRGRATSHRVFGEAMAILAGHALPTHAFQTAATHPGSHRLGARKVRAIRVLTRAAGVTGMIGGQVMDLEAEGRPYSYGALQRTESRGAHYREDFPRRNDAEWLKRTHARWKSEQDTLPTLTYEPLDVKTMELPPGWRGYGNRDYIDHPDTPARQKEVEATRTKLASSDRFAVQGALMPYDELLPARFRGRNERIDERF